MSGVITDPLIKAYADLSSTIHHSNKNIVFHNIKTVIKVYAILLSASALGVFMGKVFAMLGMAGFFFALPVVVIAGGVWVVYTVDKTAQSSNYFAQKIVKGFDDIFFSFNVNIQQAFGYRFHTSCLFPLVSKINIDSYDVVKQRYDTQNKRFFSRFY